MLVFSIALDESRVVQDKPQSAVFASSVSEDCTIKESGIDLKEMLKTFVENAIFQLLELAAVAENGAPAMLGSAIGLGCVKLMTVSQISGHFTASSIEGTWCLRSRTWTTS